MALDNVFLSYRRDDSEGYAGRLYDRLSARFPNRIFRDVKDLEPGVDYVEEIERKLKSCKAMVALIGPRWLSLTDGVGRRRIDQPDDLHRLEIVTALKRRVRVIPALVGGASMPSAESLPAELAFLARRQALPISEIDFDHDMARLIGVLEKEIGESSQGVPVIDTVPTSGSSFAQPVASPVPGRSRRLRWMVAGAGLLLALLVMIGLATQTRSPIQPQPRPEPAPSPQPAPEPHLEPAPQPTPPRSAVARRALDVAWSDGTVELTALLPQLSPDERSQIAAAVLLSQAQGGDVFAIHVRAKNTGTSDAVVNPQQFSLHLGVMATALTPGQHGQFFHGGVLRPGQVMEGLLAYPANNVAGMAIRGGSGELRYNDPSIQTTIRRR